MTRLAVRAGLDPRVVADLDEDGIDALARMVREREQEDAWGTQHEINASIVEVLMAIRNRLEAGIPVAFVQQTRKPEEVEPFPRPSWLKPERSGEDGVIVVEHVRDALRLIKGGVPTNV